jgi:hypothetical protein
MPPKSIPDSQTEPVLNTACRQKSRSTGVGLGIKLGSKLDDLFNLFRSIRLTSGICISGFLVNLWTEYTLLVCCEFSIVGKTISFEMAQAYLLVSSYCADNIQEQNQRRLVSAMEANHIDFVSVDGALQENKVFLS